MKCKYCDAELVEGKPFCPSCGKENEIPEAAVPAEETPVEETPAEETAAEAPVQEQTDAQPAEVKQGKKMTSGKLALAVVAVVAVVAIVIALVVSGMGGSDSMDGSDSVDGSYTASDKMVQAAADVVVATMGEHELTNSQLQVFYWMEVINFLNTYGDYAAYFGMDYTQPLDTQLCEDGSENPGTWQQYFLDSALETWKAYQSMTNEAEAEGFELDEDYVAALADMPQMLEETAINNGLADARELIQQKMGAGAEVDDYIHYWELFYTGSDYFSHLCEQIQPTAEEITTYFDENETTYAENGITKDTKQMNVRHILVLVEGGTTDDQGTTTYSDEEWETCRAEAQAILDEWLAGEATEDSFAALANEKSEDGGSNTNGGLYEGLTANTNFVENFKNWYLEEGRQAGDYGLVQTEYGYHVMFFSGSETIWYDTAKEDLINERASALLPDAIERNPFTIDYSVIKLGLANLTGEEETEEVVEEPEKKDNTTAIVLGAVVVIVGVLVAVLLLKPKKTAPAAEPEIQSPENPDTTEE